MSRRRPGGFTIVELLTILVILGLLAALIIPKLTRSRMRAFHSACIQNVHNLGTALQTYANDSEGQFPTGLAALIQGGSPIMKALPTCPSDDSGYVDGYEVNNGDGLYTLFCVGIHYRQLDDVAQGFPQFLSNGSLFPSGSP